MSSSRLKGKFDPMVCRPGIPALGVVLGAAALAQACTAPPREQRSAAATTTGDGECRQRIILTFALPSEPEVVNALAASAAVKLDVVSHPLPTTYVLDLATTDCATAVQKLRNAVGVRAVEPDSRRLPHQG